MDDLALWVLGWNVEGNARLASYFRERIKVPHVFTHTDFAKSEAQNGNEVISYSERHGFNYIMMVDSDVEFLYEETVPKMYEFMTSNYYPKIGSVRPWRKGEPAQSSAYPPEKKYLEDGTACMWKLNIGLRYDEELMLTGWCDYDLGNLVQYLGYSNHNDRRYPVMHNMTGSNSHNKSSFLNAMKKRSKLILDWKWWGVGFDKWEGVENYNMSVPLEMRIPTMNQIAAYTNEQQELFQSSVSVEHHDIWVKDGRKNPNLESWRNPIIVGYNTRDIWEAEHGYS